MLTEFSPSHHKHQTGLYWGLKKVNGRDYFMNWKGDYWRKVSATVIADQGPKVKWQTVYELLDEQGSAILKETQIWSMQQSEGKFLLDLEWRGEAKIEVRMEKFYVGGLFLRMPWREGVEGEVINADGKKMARRKVSVLNGTTSEYRSTAAKIKHILPSWITQKMQLLPLPGELTTSWVLDLHDKFWAIGVFKRANLKLFDTD